MVIATVWVRVPLRVLILELNMYHVIDDISSLKKIVFCDYYNYDDEDKVIPVKQLIVDLYGKKYTLPDDKDLSLQWKGIYNNIIVTAPELEGEMIILQDYGMGCSSKEEYYELPLDFLLSNNFPSLMWYNNSLWHCELDYNTQSTLVCIRLCDYSKIDLNNINSKRPYNINLLVEKNYTLQSPLYFNIRIYYNDKTDDLMLKALPTYGELINPTVLQDTINTIAEYGSFGKTNENTEIEYLTRDYLVNKGFSYNADSKSWSNGVITIKDNGELPPDEVFDYGDIPLFTRSSFDNLLKEKQ